MLNDTTKRKINSLRDILVGVVPGPEAQVNQITNALIYKYMDDMDQQAVVYGGKPSFFVKEYEKYSWKNLMDPKKGGQERMNLYVEALEKMGTNKNLSPIFRDILKSAFLPYRSPETLNLFLSEVDGFSYDHSEELGNAFEYLLAIMGSQGDAGMFRTPRHIIDFIVKVVDPKKDETVLDPACGTAGFLISAYKHIIGNHDGIDNETGKATSKEARLSADEIKKIHGNFCGYDINPDMTKFSRVNMFLHNFPDPKIFDYDTLSSDERWDENFDVILANPPFMTPKGGIIPHKRFSVPANRAEVLFVDYIMNHLRPKGRAGIIVPEGIIFQSGTVYKQLRKNLVEDGLYAVVSLPSGVFAPYSGVKTSILLFNNELAKKSEEICFVKVENDGFDLGAQRRAGNKNDLPQALEILNKWNTGEKAENKLVMYVEKTKIAENGDYNLSGDRYRVATDYTNAKWPIVELGVACELYQPKTITSKEILEKGSHKVFGANGVIGYFDKYNHEDPEVLITCRGATCGTINLSEAKSWVTGNAMVAKPKDESKINKTYLYYILNHSDFSSVISGAAQPQITRQSLSPFKIPIPPLEIQEQIVAELNGYAGIISGVKQITQNWKPKIDIDANWEMVKLGEVAKLTTGGTPLTSKKEYYGGDVKWLVSGDINKGEIFDCNGRITNLALKESNARLLPVNSVLIALNGQGKTRGTVAILRIEAACNQSLVSINPEREKLLPEFLLYVLRGKYQEIRNINGDNQRGGLNMPIIRSIEIPLPPIKIQEKIVGKIEAERTLVESAKKMIEIYEQKTKATIAKLWSE
ncbi:MAG: N-6 DNA methylase [Deltaproteobacteria bacterium CG_4_9_14_3_um_filter_44_9]|nr:MAG: N-6 DNA methylase [Deltaproteobacteria bacterium CG_4_9_14_3_um_filter_44_9]